MATIRNQSAWSVFKRRFQNSWRIMFAPGDLMTLLILVVILLLPIMSLQIAGWMIDLTIILPITLLSVIFGFCWRVVIMMSYLLYWRLASMG